MISSTTRPSLLGLLSIVIVCISFCHHVYSFQSMYIVSFGARTDGSALQTIDRFSSSFVSPLKLFASTLSEESNSTSLKAATNSKRKKSKFTIQWEKTFDLLAAYNEREGHANVPKGHKEEGVNLGQWLMRQRKLYRAGKLLPERQHKLESLGVEWTMLKNQWEKKFDLLAAYNEREGHANVPQGHKEEGVNLGQWLMSQRELYRAGKLLPERQHKLESLGVEWTMLKNQWEKTFNLLAAYNEREGHANVPQGHKEEGVNLGFWLLEQRVLQRSGQLQAERQQKLESLGVEWDPFENQWEMMVDLLTCYIEREGHAVVPFNHEEGGQNLGTWLMNQRKLYKAGKLQAERQQKLESLGVEWDGMSAREAMRKKRWERMFDLLCIYEEREGHGNVPYEHREDEEGLGGWLTYQRRLYRTGKLQIERQNKLESLGVDLKMQRKPIYNHIKWEKKFDLLCIYREREGNPYVPDKHIEDGDNLGEWLNTQRRLYKDGRLLAERQHKLESLGVEWDGDVVEAKRLEKKWQSMFSLLCAYNEREGHTNVPINHIEDGDNLGKWLATQRRLYKDGTLVAERQSKLESLGVEWNLGEMNVEMLWQSMFSLLCAYNEREGHANVPKKHKEGGENLGFWLAHQRRLYKAGKLKAERQSKLESLGVEWKLR